MTTKVRRSRKSLYIFLILLAAAAILAAVLFLSGRNSKETGLPVEQTEEPTVSAEATDTAEATEETSDAWLETYNWICEYIDQGDARSAVDTLLADQSAHMAYESLHAEDPALLEAVLVEAACYYNEDGKLFNIVDLRQRGYFSDEMFGRYWERVGFRIPDALSENADYDEYLFQELLNWYERGNEASGQIIDLHYVGMIDDALYGALVAAWEVDLMDSVDMRNYVPQYGMELSESEKEQIRIWQSYVDEGEGRKAAEMVLNGDITENIYYWMQKDNASLFDMVQAQGMYEIATDGAYEQIARLIIGGYVSDDCFERYWSLQEFTPAENKRTREEYPNVDMYFVYEIERICSLTNDASLVQNLWNDQLIDDYLYDLLIVSVGGWEME